MATPSGRNKKVSGAPSSRYTQGGEVDVYPSRTGWWERRIINKDDTDITVIITPQEEGRADLIAYNLYERPNMAWVVLQYNNIVDTATELTVGKVLRMPTLRRLTLDVLGRQTGGNVI